MLPSLNHIILTVALQALREGNIHHCETMGFTYDEMNLLGCLSINDLITLSQAPLPLVDITIRHDVLQKLLASSHEENRRQEQLNRAVRLGGLNRTDEPLFRGWLQRNLCTPPVTRCLRSKRENTHSG